MAHNTFYVIMVVHIAGCCGVDGTQYSVLMVYNAGCCGGDDGTQYSGCVVDGTQCRVSGVDGT